MPANQYTKATDAFVDQGEEKMARLTVTCYLSFPTRSFYKHNYCDLFASTNYNQFLQMLTDTISLEMICGEPCHQRSL